MLSGTFELQFETFNFSSDFDFETFVSLTYGDFSFTADDLIDYLDDYITLNIGLLSEGVGVGIY